MDELTSQTENLVEVSNCIDAGESGEDKLPRGETAYWRKSELWH